MRGIRDDQLRAIVKEAKRQGWLIDKTGNQHYRLRNPANGFWTTISGTTEDRRASRNARAELRRGGLDI